jgi:hypothetical protein
MFTVWRLARAFIGGAGEAEGASSLMRQAPVDESRGFTVRLGRVTQATLIGRRQQQMHRGEVFHGERILWNSQSAASGDRYW